MDLLIYGLFTLCYSKSFIHFNVKRAHEARDQFLFCDLQNVQQQHEIDQNSLSQLKN